MSKTIECCACSIEFCVPDRFETDRRNDHKSFYCPSGHRQSYKGKSKLDKANQEIAELKQSAAWYRGRLDEARSDRDHWQAVAYGYKGAMRKYQNEIRLVS